MLLKIFLLGACYGQDISDIFSIIASAAFNEILASANTSSPVQLPQLDESQVKVRAGTEEDARYYFSFATLAYCNSSVIHEWKCNSCHAMGPGWKAHEVIRDPKLETQGVVAVNHQRKEIGISIRGSNSFTNQIQNALFELVMLNGFDQTIKGHLGFSSIARGLQTQMIQSVRSILEQRVTQNYSVTMVGHSMGGAVALLLSLDLQREYNFPWERISIYTYGSPRVGNLGFVNHVNSLPLKLTRVINENDIVPHLPPNYEGYFHTLFELYLHDSQARICSSQFIEDETCSRSRVGNLTQDVHSFAWDKALNPQTCQPYSA